MRNLFISFKQILRLIINDSMLIIIGFGPIMFGLVVKFGIPLFNDLVIKKYIGFQDFSKYYQLIDLFLYVMIPLLICFIPAMVILEEIDDKTSKYLMVTPLKSSGYIISRLVFPSIIALIITLIIGFLCSLTKMSFMKLFILSLLSNLSALTLTMFIVCMAKNKVEGMAICKMSSILLLGTPVPYFLLNGYQYMFSFLPSFWIAKYAISNNFIDTVICILVSSIWLTILYKKFKVKIAN